MKHILYRDGDTLSNFDIHSAYGVTPSNAFLWIGGDDGGKKLALSTFDEEHHVGLVNNALRDVSLILEFPRSTDLNRLTISFSYDVYLLNTPLSRLLASSFTNRDRISMKALAHLKKKANESNELTSLTTYR